MHFHLPKPLHGWREFVGEVGIIVIGVLIALGAEQIAEGFHWRREVAAGRDALKPELRRIAMQSMEREADSPCLGRRLKDIQSIIEEASESSRLPPVGPIGAPVVRLWHLESWNSLRASETATHFPREEMLQLGNLEAYLGTVSALNNSELEDWTVLSTIVGPGRRLAPGEEPLLRQAVARAGYHAKMLRIAAHQLLDHIRQDQLLSAAELSDAARQEAPDVRELREKDATCRPLGSAPPDYGHSPISLDLIGPYPSG